MVAKYPVGINSLGQLVDCRNVTISNNIITGGTAGIRRNAGLIANKGYFKGVN